MSAASVDAARLSPRRLGVRNDSAGAIQLEAVDRSGVAGANAPKEIVLLVPLEPLRVMHEDDLVSGIRLEHIGHRLGRILIADLTACGHTRVTQLPDHA